MKGSEFIPVQVDGSQILEIHYIPVYKSSYSLKIKG